MNRSVLLLAVLPLLSACASMQQLSRERTCTPDAAFASGVNDALAGREMEPAYGAPCLPEELPPARLAYREGYLEGLARRPPPAPGEPGRGWTCEVKAFGEAFVEPGATEAQAAARARAACRAKNAELHCSDVACRVGK